DTRHSAPRLSRALRGARGRLHAGPTEGPLPGHTALSLAVWHPASRLEARQRLRASAVRVLGLGCPTEHLALSDARAPPVAARGNHDADRDRHGTVAHRLALLWRPAPRGRLGRPARVRARTRSARGARPLRDPADLLSAVAALRDDEVSRQCAQRSARKVD